jgi:hypothetical protein
MTYIKELKNYFKFDNKLSRFRGPTQKKIFNLGKEAAIEGY